jgi:uncharacterized protein (TIGR00725 family)
MEAAARGAYRVHGRTIAILKEQGDGTKPEYGLTIWTGLGDARNFVNAAAADAMVALQGEAGTLSEIAMALKLTRPVVCLQAWEYLRQANFNKIAFCQQAEMAVREAFDSIGADAAGFVEAVGYPSFPDQSLNQRRFEEMTGGWSSA